MKRLRVYVDTSVFSGCFDEEFAAASRKLFEEIAAGRFVLLVSNTTLEELEEAPKPVRELLAGLPKGALEIILRSDETSHLRESYLAEGVVGSSSLADAEHIACASVAEADLVVSWNFKHIVHFEKIRGYHAVNIGKAIKPSRFIARKRWSHGKEEEEIRLRSNEGGDSKKAARGTSDYVAGKVGDGKQKADSCRSHPWTHLAHGA